MPGRVADPDGVCRFMPGRVADPDGVCRQVASAGGQTPFFPMTTECPSQCPHSVHTLASVAPESRVSDTGGEPASIRNPSRINFFNCPQQPHCCPRFTTPTRHQPAYHRTACLHLRSFCSCEHILSMSVIALGEVHEVQDVDDPHHQHKKFTTAKWPGTPSGRAFGPTLRPKRMRPHTTNQLHKLPPHIRVLGLSGAWQAAEVRWV